MCNVSFIINMYCVRSCKPYRHYLVQQTLHGAVVIVILFCQFTLITLTLNQVISSYQIRHCLFAFTTRHFVVIFLYFIYLAYFSLLLHYYCCCYWYCYSEQSGTRVSLGIKKSSILFYLILIYWRSCL